jgi:hypothetical protein
MAVLTIMIVICVATTVTIQQARPMPVWAQGTIYSMVGLATAGALGVVAWLHKPFQKSKDLLVSADKLTVAQKAVDDFLDEQDNMWSSFYDHFSSSNNSLSAVAPAPSPTPAPAIPQLRPGSSLELVRPGSSPTSETSLQSLDSYTTAKSESSSSKRDSIESIKI